MDQTSHNVSSSTTPQQSNESNDDQDSESLPADTDSINTRVVRKLDFILLPFLCLFFLVNSLDRSNIGNAETARFTEDAGLNPSDLNTAVALFFSFFVVLQPVGAACGRRFGMARWVPSCMVIWGICTSLHVWVTAAWQLYLLRSVIGILEAGFYPTTVAYMSLFYTRYEFARRLGMFYGQYAVAGALGGILAYLVFTAFPRDLESSPGAWRSWQVLFLLEGGLTIVVAAAGFFWLPMDAETAWFFSDAERKWASKRIAKDRMETQLFQTQQPAQSNPTEVQGVESDTATIRDDREEEEEEASRLLQPSNSSTTSTRLPSNFTGASGLAPADIVAAFTDWKVYYLLLLNILSAIPATAFSVFLPLVVQGVGIPATTANLLTAPPFAIGAAVLWLFVWWSDRTRRRIRPILAGLAVLMLGLAAAVLLPRAATVPRYLALCVLLAGSFVASPLTIAWLAGNIEQPGKRAIVLGINGWGNLSGVCASLLFDERFAPGYTLPFFVTLACVAVAFAGFVAFEGLVRRENAWRARVLRGWGTAEVRAERRSGKGPLPAPRVRVAVLRLLGRWRGVEFDGGGEGRVGEEKITFVFGL